MPLPGRSWRHIILGMYGSWLPGDPRGWRSRQHKNHSSGDYKSPPPPGEHSGLHAVARAQVRAEVNIPPEFRPILGQAFLHRLTAENCRALAMSVSGQHAHLLAEFPQDLKSVRYLVGKCKETSSRTIRHILPGQVWAQGGRYLLIRNPNHQQSVYRYILAHAQEHAWVWTFQD